MNEYNVLEMLIFGTFAMGVVSFFVTLILLYFTLDRRIKKEFRQKYGFTDPHFWILRVATYSRYVVFSNRVKKDRHVLMDYHGFDFRSFASPLEILLSYIIMYSFFLLVTLTIVAYISDFFGYIELD